MANSIDIQFGPFSTSMSNSFLLYLNMPGGTLLITENNTNRDTLNQVSDILESTLLGYVDIGTSLIENTAQNAVSNNTLKLMDSLGIDQESLNTASSLIGLLNNKVAILGSILKYIPTNIYAVPSAKEISTSIVASYKEILVASYLEVKNLYILTKNAYINNTPNTLEILLASTKVIIDMMYDQINDLCVQYTGLTIEQMYNKCIEGINKYKEYKEARKNKKNKLQSDDKSEELETENLQEIANFNKTGNKKTYKVSIDANEAKGKLMAWLRELSDTLYNCFFIVSFRDIITDIQYILSQSTECNLSTLADSINTAQDFIDLLKEFGADDSSMIITLDEAKAGLINAIGGAMSSLTMIAKDFSMGDTGIHAGMSTESETTFDISTDVNTKTITISFFDNPTKSSILNKVYNVFKKAKNNDKKHTKVFNESELSALRMFIKQTALNNEKTAECKINIYNIKIVNNFDFNSTTTTTKQPKDKEAKKSEKAKNKVLLDFLENIVEEDFTMDPQQPDRRKTIELIHVLFDLFKQIMPYFKMFATLVNNYNTNKALVQEHSHKNLYALLLKTAFEKGLDKQVDKNTCNFYTVRTLNLYDFVKANFGINDNATINISIEQTTLLISWLKNHNENVNILNSKLPTTLYIDNNTINELKQQLDSQLQKASEFFGEDTELFIKYPESRYKNGSTKAIQGVEENSRYVFYTDSSLPLYNSLIWNAFQMQLDPTI